MACRLLVARAARKATKIATTKTSAMAHLLTDVTIACSRRRVARSRTAKTASSNAALIAGTVMLKRRISPATKSFPELCRLRTDSTMLCVWRKTSRDLPRNVTDAVMLRTGSVSPGQSRTREITVSTTAAMFRSDMGARRGGKTKRAAGDDR